MAQQGSCLQPDIEVSATAPGTAPTFEAIYAEHFGYVWRILRRLGLTEADALDVCQEVFLAVHRGLRAFEGRSSLRTWIHRIAFRAAKDHRRRAHVRREVLDQAPWEGRTASAGEPNQASRLEALELLEIGLSVLTLEQRMVFTSFELEGETCAHIAEVLEVPLGTVYSRLRKARTVFIDTVRRLDPPETAARRGAGGTR